MVLDEFGNQPLFTLIIINLDRIEYSQFTRQRNTDVVGPVKLLENYFKKYIYPAAFWRN